QDQSKIIGLIKVANTGSTRSSNILWLTSIWKPTELGILRMARIFK
ncbi:8191_t:CDS:2, partial [Funneliformis caledonium]